jgi:hypothetical protein
MRCDCGGLGVVTDASAVGDGLWMTTWWIEHREGCGGAADPARSFLMDVEAFLHDGDRLLPGVKDEPRPRCRAIGRTTGRPCQSPAGLDGWCGNHRPRPRDDEEAREAAALRLLREEGLLPPVEDP